MPVYVVFAALWRIRNSGRTKHYIPNRTRKKKIIKNATECRVAASIADENERHTNCRRKKQTNIKKGRSNAEERRMENELRAKVPYGPSCQDGVFFPFIPFHYDVMLCDVCWMPCSLYTSNGQSSSVCYRLVFVGVALCVQPPFIVIIVIGMPFGNIPLARFLPTPQKVYYVAEPWYHDEHTHTPTYPTYPTYLLQSTSHTHTHTLQPDDCVA